MAGFLINTSCRILAAFSTLAIVIGLQARPASADPPETDQKSARSQLLAAADRLLEQGGNGSMSLAFGPYEAIVAVARTRVPSDRDLGMRRAWLEAIGLAASKLPAPPEKEPVRVRAASALRLVEDLDRKEIAIAIACWPDGVEAQAGAAAVLEFESLDSARAGIMSSLADGGIVPIGGDCIRLADGRLMAVAYGTSTASVGADADPRARSMLMMVERQATLEAESRLPAYLQGQLVVVSSEGSPEGLPGGSSRFEQRSVTSQSSGVVPPTVRQPIVRRPMDGRSQIVTFILSEVPSSGDAK